MKASISVSGPLKTPSVSRRSDHNALNFFKRTVAAQIHLLGFAAAVTGLVILLVVTWHRADRLQFWSCAGFGGTSILVFAMSSVYHFLHDGLTISARLTQILEDLDHFAIYLFIAGTYTPIVLHTLSHSEKLAMIIAVWSLALGGIAYTHLKPRLPAWAQNRFFSTGIFVLMGWLAIVRLEPIVAGLSTLGRVMLAAGALSYTLGAVVYATKRPVLAREVFGFHELWHVMVVVGFVCHYLLILDFYYPF